MVKDSLGEVDFPLDAWVRMAQDAQRNARNYRGQGDIESAYVEDTKAAVALNKVSAHPDYMVSLNSRRQHNTSLVS